MFLLAAQAVDELLDRAKGGVVLLALLPQQREGVAELRMQPLRAVARHWQPTALLRSIFGKCGHDDVPTGLDGSHHDKAAFGRDQFTAVGDLVA